MGGSVGDTFETTSNTHVAIRARPSALPATGRSDIVRLGEHLAQVNFRTVRLLVFVMLVGVALIAPIASLGIGRASRLLASDSFSRTSPAGWGAAETGGRYLYPAGNSGLTVNGSAGLLKVPADGAAHSAELSDVLARDVNEGFSFKLFRGTTDAGVVVAASLRRTSPDNQYLARARLAADGSIYLSFVRVQQGRSSQLGGEALVPGLSSATSRSLRLRARAYGVAPTTLQAKVWIAGAKQPVDWQITRLDSGNDLETAGHVGLQATASTAGQPTTMQVDNLKVNHSSGGGRHPRPTPTPPPPPVSYTQQTLPTTERV
jgi:hypothetical protein